MFRPERNVKFQVAAVVNDVDRQVDLAKTGFLKTGFLLLLCNNNHNDDNLK